MKLFLTLAICCLLITKNKASAQSESQKSYRNFPIVLSIQFHSLAMPFKDLKGNFCNVGFGIGTEISHSGLNNWIQQFDVIWIKNKGIGNAILFSTQTAWRPMLAGNAYSELKAGIGYMKAFRPSQAFQQVDGNWIEPMKKWKGMLTIPVGIGIGYYYYSESTYVSPFTSYQMMLVKNYNQDIPFVPQSLIQIGSRIYPNYSNDIKD